MELLCLNIQSLITLLQMINHPLISAAEQQVVNIFSQKMGKEFVFHSFEHTREVVLRSELIAGNYELSEDEHTALILAAWFHDTGYAIVPGKYHEEESIRMATEFLNLHNASEQIKNLVCGCIMATKMPQSPTNLVEQIICDADLFHLGTDEFNEKSKLLRREINALREEKISKKEWRKINIELLERHRYFTEYAKENIEPVKQLHLKELLKKEGGKDKEVIDEPAIAEINIIEPVPEENKSNEKLKATKDSRSERGIVAMFRIMSESHINLSQMADSKANIMISVNTIVISIMISVLLGKLQFYPEFIIPSVILVSVCLTAVVFAILATRPNISGGTFTREDINNKQINLLFFGNFYNMQLPDYDWAMKEMMKDKDYLYGSMIKDMYFLGLVLARKYKFLRISYNIFMFGLIAAILAFGVAFIFGGEQGG